MVSDIVIFTLGLAGLWFGAGAFIKGGRTIAGNLGVSDIIIGLTLGAIGTSLPELIVSWMAAGVGRTSISIGNAVGSNMANIGLALGLGAILLPIPVGKAVIKYDYWVLLFSGVLLYGFSRNHIISNVEGTIFILLWIAYIVFLATRHYFGTSDKKEDRKKAPMLLGFIYFIAGAAGLLLGAKFVVQGASEFASQWGVTETVIGILVVAVGTSLPEIAVVLAGSIKKVHGISLGTIIGSNIFNILLVAGGSAIISPIKLFPQEILIQAPAVILMTMLLLPVIFTHKKITRGEGILLFVTYGIYVYFVI